MAQASFEAALTRVLADEGGYVNHPNDPGGPTNFGITLAVARQYWKSDASAADLKGMPISAAKAIYRKRYWDALICDALPPGFDYSMFDAGVNSGVGRAPVWARAALGASANVGLNEIALQAGRASDKVKLIQAYWARRLSFLKGLKTWSVFGRGWGRRVAEGEAAAVKMWLALGAMMSPQALQVALQKQSTKAKTTSKAQAGGALGSAAAVPTAPATIDPTPLGIGGKVAIAFFIATLVALAIWLFFRSRQNQSRSDAYAAEAATAVMVMETRGV